jgi:hypothetical protein
MFVLILDRDLFHAMFTRAEIRIIRTSGQAPRANAMMRRWVGFVRRGTTLSFGNPVGQCWRTVPSSETSRLAVCGDSDLDQRHELVQHGMVEQLPEGDLDAEVPADPGENPSGQHRVAAEQKEVRIVVDLGTENRGPGVDYDLPDRAGCASHGCVPVPDR